MFEELVNTEKINNDRSSLLQDFAEAETKMRVHEHAVSSDKYTGEFYDKYEDIKREAKKDGLQFYESIYDTSSIDQLLNLAKYQRRDIYESVRRDEDTFEQFTYMADTLGVLATIETDSEESDKQRRSAIRSLFEGYKNVSENSLAQEAILEADLDHNQKLRLVVEYANVNGFMDTIYWLSNGIKGEYSEWPQESKDEMAEIYKELQGITDTEEGDLVEVLEDWTGVYKGVDITSWYPPELTKEEIDDFENWMKKFARKDPSTAKIVDLAAGMGRHTEEMSVERGWENVTAAEYSSQYIESIRKIVGDKAKVKQVDWLNLIQDLEIDPGSVDGLLFEGRSIMHNATLEKMLRTFDQISMALSKDGIAVADFAVPDFGKYMPKVEKMNQNFDRLGIHARAENLIFDGPNPAQSYNRLALNRNHVESLAALVGLKVVETKTTEKDVHGKVGNIYYVLQKSSEPISREERLSALENLRYLQDPSSDTGLKLESWGGASVDDLFLDGSGKIGIYVEDGVEYLQRAA